MLTITTPRGQPLAHIHTKRTMKTLTVYEAKDGKRFETAEACDKHDRLPERIKTALATGVWRETSKELAPDSEEVLTKIDKDGCCRNQQTLKRQGNLWFFPDGSMYVYYVPTHWMLLPP